MSSKISSVLTSIATALAVLSGAVAVPLFLRPFYAWQIAPLHLEGVLGLQRSQILAAYNDVMDYCLGLRPHFAAGVLPFSAAGAAHFADVRALFLLDLSVLAVSMLVLAGLALWRKRADISNHRFGGHTPGFWSACGLGSVFLIIGITAAGNFSRAFVFFHMLFFPGKQNWVFDPATDPVIWLLPQAYFRNCALLILGTLLFLCALLLWQDLRAHKKRRRRN